VLHHRYELIRLEEALARIAELDRRESRQPPQELIPMGQAQRRAKIAKLGGARALRVAPALQIEQPAPVSNGIPRIMQQSGGLWADRLPPGRLFREADWPVRGVHVADHPHNAANVDLLLVIGDPEDRPRRPASCCWRCSGSGFAPPRGSSTRLRGTGSIELFVGRRV